MSKCLNCNNEAKGRSAYCGDTCKVAWNRNKKRNTEALIKSVTPVTDNVIPKQTFEEFSKTHIVATVKALPKRGKDIKVFADLPPHVQRTIDMMSTVDGKIDKTVKANRTAIAINYQHIFPDRFHSVGVA